MSQSPVTRGNAGNGNDSSAAVDVEQSEKPFHPNEVARLKINFTRDEYTTLNEPIFGYVIVHDDDEAPPVRERSFLIMPGNYYEFFLSKQTEMLLKKPYATDCVEYVSKWS